LQFAYTARCLQEAARAAGLTVPAFRSPPRRRDVARTIRRLPGGAVVAVRVNGRPADQVQHDMIDGVIVANRLDGRAAERTRHLLWRAINGVGPDRPARRAA